ncbi:MAG: hypothetical protein LUD79_02225 [Oscillospiraceae bacterium]|nr:hypothetical protein [Oscillospiraceae bacterium]
MALYQAQGAACGGCSQDCSGCAGGCSAHLPALNPAERELLHQLSSVLYLPMAQFLLLPKGGAYEDGTLILSPVLLETEADTLETVMERAEALVSLARKGLISLDFDLPLSNCTYEVYYRSDLFREFSARYGHVAEERPVLRRGSVAVTERGLDWESDL